MGLYYTLIACMYFDHHHILILSLNNTRLKKYNTKLKKSNTKLRNNTKLKK